MKVRDRKTGSIRKECSKNEKGRKQAEREKWSTVYSHQQQEG